MDELTKILRDVWQDGHDWGKKSPVDCSVLSEARSAIMAWVEGILPEANKDVPSSEPEEDSPEYNRAIGWNACLQEIKARLKEGVKSWRR